MGYKDSWKQRNVAKCQAHSRRSMAKWRKANPETCRANRLKYHLGISVDQYDALFIAQNGLCAICKQPESAQQNRIPQHLAVDHDHSCCPDKKSCGRCIRGLLCSRCNLALGHLYEDISRMQAMIAYVQKSRESRSIVGNAEASEP